MKKIRRCLSLAIVTLLFLPLITGFDRQVSAVSAKSSVGIRFEGSVPQTSSSESQNGASEQDSQVNPEHKQYPKTNEKSNSGLIIVGLLLVVACVGWIIWKMTKKESKK